MGESKIRRTAASIETTCLEFVLVGDEDLATETSPSGKDMFGAGMAWEGEGGTLLT